ncbi:putative protein N(5)-glutamine methyltransferase [Falsibacillus pallidus]|uniref:peptide chain release factor N(5)-glutamine methyltransferase n=1 Tax=Falsibacillus pallidus TaxID=493781 RepID=A0A370GEF2_9BACI|nr:putative protein N(5)-glutamine methyltransferase [Falsibacillus pallidus]RDI42172.1 release factor glutamine methyltransferase [Falsibacillus pallidus]
MLPESGEGMTEQEVVTILREAGCVFAEEEARLLLSEDVLMEELILMVNRRAEGIPLEYVIGATVFCGIRIQLDKGVFVPRRRTEFLVEQACALARSDDIVMDLCCGSGAVGAAIAAGADQISLYAADIDPAAIQCAEQNLKGYRASVFQGDLYKPLPQSLKGTVNILTANTPYVPTAEIERLPQEARLYEPKTALDGGADGLDLQRKIAKEAPLWLAHGGHLLIETSERQAALTFEIFKNAGLAPWIVRNEEWDATVVVGTRVSID